MGGGGDEDGSFNLRRVQAADDIPVPGSPQGKALPSGCGVRGGNACDPQRMFLGLAPFPWLLWDWSLLSHLLCHDEVTPRRSLRV